MIRKATPITYSAQTFYNAATSIRIAADEAFVKIEEGFYALRKKLTLTVRIHWLCGIAVFLNQAAYQR